MTSRVAVAAPNRLAADAGLAAARAGGGAVDVAIAAMTTAMSSEPGIVSPMAGGFITIWPPDGPPEVIDGNIVMPGRDRPAEAFGGGLREVTTTYGGGLTLLAGHGSVGVPGIWAALGRAHERHGAAPWADLLAPATAVARDGYPVGAAAASYLALVGDSIYGWDPGTHALLHHADGRVVTTGDIVVQPDLAATFDTIAREGWQSVHTGSIARAIVADMDARGGLVSAADLADYEAVVRQPLLVDVGQWQVATNPPPAIGGPMLSLMLGALVERGGERATWADVIEIQRRVLSFRADRIDRSRDLEADGWAALAAAQRYGLDGLPTSPNTVHVSVVDGAGMACSITASAGYGSGAMVPGTGLLLNNCLGELELNQLGVHALAPGTRLASNMAPTVAAAADGRRLAIGSPGADRITTALMQVLGAAFLDDEHLQDAIDRPRVHVRIDGGGVVDDGVLVEHESDPAIARAVADGGWHGREHEGISMYFGGVGAALRHADGTLLAAADPRRVAATALG
ncbi:gamma-glutamyltransferase [Janibacter sp. G56]|uniref:gamma-glutamyltransferase n=1 Tax=Janibacter sp. G56 TaxID=3418717 RepID=UPI003CFE61FC